MIQAADWHCVSKIHHIPIPPEVKAALDNLSLKPSTSPTSSRQIVKASTMPPLDRKTSNGSPPSKLIIPGKATPAVPIPGKGLATMSRSMSSNSVSPSPTSVEQLNSRRSGQIEATSERQSNSTQSSPNRKHIDLDSPTTARRHSGSRTSLPAVNSLPLSGSKPALDLRSQSSQSPERRRAPNSSSISKSSPPSRGADRPPAFSTARNSKKDDDGLSSASSSSGSSSMTDSTITSDGAFTDYLSDESEEELQRQAEAKAALVAQNQAEEMEFKAARQQLAHVDLRPPKTWNPTSLDSNASRVATKG